jgi:preprotein translocase subunit SecE
MMRIGEVAKFIDQVKQEAKRITWPDKKDLITSGSIVIVSVLIFSLITMLLDYTIHSLMDFLLNIGK